ncbi:MAG: YicC/YloC family endoribonuclease [Phycisphaerales bacterium]|nr:YicC/YloC family endoribonuclease [Phycisphaerales bacterium]
MTGFGDASTQEGGEHYFAEVKSLNNKYFKAVIRLPDALQALEAELETVLRNRLSRGTVTLVASCSVSSAAAAYSINQGALARYIEQLVSTPGVDAGAINIASLLSLPGVLQPPEGEADRLQRARGILVRLTNQACDKLIEMRAREGEALRTELLAHKATIAERLSHISVRAPIVVSDYEKRLKQRIDALLEAAGARVDAVDVIREIAAYAERTDIAEEVMRLSGHLVQFEELLSHAEPRPVGRTLDFLAQEMLREANTIASKSPDAEISRHIVEVKGAIDRIKEQAANAE